MLIFGLIAALAFYLGLFWLYQTAAAAPGAYSVLSTINKALFMPEPAIFFLLRSLIIITLFYVVADALISPTRRGLKDMKQRRIDAERDKLAFRGIKPAVAPSEDDDDAFDSAAPGSNFAPPRYSA
jgi:hypothetical protein